MPHGVSSTRVREAINSALVVDGEDLHTIRPLWALPTEARVRVADSFVGLPVEVEVWPTRDPEEPTNWTVHSCRVLSAAYNKHWQNGMTVLILEFEEGLKRRDLVVPMSSVRSIRTVRSEEDNNGE